nr:uncharacterized protein LOC100185293 [Ciona intestinalis]|eukprot:XP_002127277.1 uncharacterized protein LOC100185293 [Ciona intestinalis]
MSTATDKSEMFMWENDTSLTLHQMRDFVLGAMSRPHITVLVPRRNVKVPHAKSKKLQLLQSKPRDINASPFLLMVAPPSDCRYQNYIKTFRDKRCVTQHRRNLQHEHQNHQRATTQHVHSVMGPNQAWLNSQPLGNTQQVPGMDYYQQISTIAAMAWSDCSQATEKLRRIYEQTSILSRDPFTMIASYGSPYVSAPVQTEAKKNLEFQQHVPLQSMPKRSVGNGILKPRNRDGYWEIPSVYCACAVCEMTKRTKSNMTSQRTNADVPKALMTYVSAKQRDNRTIDQQCATSVTSHHRGKRVHSPDDGIVMQLPPRKQAKHENYPPSIMQTYDQQHHMLHQHPEPVRTSDAILSYLKSSNKQPSSTSAYLNHDIFLQPSLQIPSTSYMTSSNGDVINASDLMATPSFENRCFSSAQPNTGLFNGFSSYLAPQILNALE